MTHSYSIQPIAERVARSLQTISINFQFSTSIFMRFIISTIYSVVLIANPMGRNLVRWKVLEIILRFCATLWAIGCTWKLPNFYVTPSYLTNDPFVRAIHACDTRVALAFVSCFTYTHHASFINLSAFFHMRHMTDLSEILTRTRYGVATISRLLKIISLFCKGAL